MLVRELIERLKTFDQEMHVAIEQTDGMLPDIVDLAVVHDEGQTYEDILVLIAEKD
jgi:hypothetical protein